MNQREFETQILDYLDDQLAPADRERFETALAASPSFQALLADYRKMMETEQVLGMQTADPGPSFDVKVMDRVEAVRPVNLLEVVRMVLSTRVRFLGGLAATAATLVLAVKLTADPEAHIPVLASPSPVAAPAALEPAPPPSGTPAPVATLVPPLPASEPASSVTVPPGGATQAPLTGIKKSTVMARTDVFDSSSAEDGRKQDGQPTKMRIVDEMAYSSQPDALQAIRPNDASAPKVTGDQLEQRASRGRTAAVFEGSVDKKDSVATEAQRLAVPRPQAEASQDTFRRAPGLNKEAQPSVSATKLNDGIPFADRVEPAPKKREIEGYRRANPYTGEKRLPPPTAQGGSGSVGGSVYQSLNSSPQASSRAATAEQYIAYEENPRISTSQEPMSTFGVDVDTASYTNIRRYLANGQLPPPASVRIEELLNYFHYDYPSERERPFGLTYEIAPSPLESGRHLLRVALKSRELQEQTKPWNLVFLIDVSGSMAPENRLPLIQSGLRALVQKMTPNDKVSIVTYAGESRVALEATSVSDRERILSAISALHAGGSTNGASGIQQAYDIATRSFISGGVNRVVLATDGDFNVGVTSHTELVRLIEEKRRSGVTLTVLGVGNDNIHDGTLEQIANKGDGNYFYLDTLQEARRVLEQNIASTMEVVAKDVKLQVEFNPRYVAQYRLIGYDNRKLENNQFNDDSVDSGEIGSGHAVTALYEVTLTDSPLANDVSYRYRDGAPTPIPAPSDQFAGELGFLKIRYKAPESSQSQLLEFPLTRASVRATSTETTDDFRFAAAVSYFGHLLRNSKFVGSYSFNDIATLAEGARGSDRDGRRQEFIELVRNAAVGRK